MTSSIQLKRKPGESELEFINRIGLAKQQGIIDKTWNELADVFNRELREDGEQYNESTYRKKFASIRQFQDEFNKNIVDEENLVELRRELEKEKVKVRDERNEYRRLIREEARKESYREQFIHGIEEAAGKHPLRYDPSSRKQIVHGDTVMVIPLSDVHCGIVIHNYWNDYDQDVLRQMLNYYLDYIKDIAARHNVGDVIVLGSELVSGIIHDGLRLQNNQDLIDQFITVTDYVCDFLAALSQQFNTVKFYVAPGNHSRINPKKDDSLSHENIENLVVPFVRSRMQNYPNIICCDNEVDPGIVTVTVLGQKLVFVHGDLDTMSNATKNMTRALGYVPDIIVLGHRHFNAFMTENTTKIIQSGSFVSTDEYAASKRLIGPPEQSPFIVTNNGVECIYNVKF